MPYAEVSRTRAATLALRMTFLLGKHAMLGHEPPMSARSITTDRPSLLRQLPRDVLAGLTASKKVDSQYLPFIPIHLANACRNF